MPNSSAHLEDVANQPVYFKNASYGPWKFCWLDRKFLSDQRRYPSAQNPFECHTVQYIVDDDPSDVTTGVQRVPPSRPLYPFPESIRKSFYFMITGVTLSAIGTLNSVICALLPNPYASLFLATVMHINAGGCPSPSLHFYPRDN